VGALMSILRVLGCLLLVIGGALGLWCLLAAALLMGELKALREQADVEELVDQRKIMKDLAFPERELGGETYLVLTPSQAEQLRKICGGALPPGYVVSAYVPEELNSPDKPPSQGRNS